MKLTAVEMGMALAAARAHPQFQGLAGAYKLHPDEHAKLQTAALIAKDLDDLAAFPPFVIYGALFIVIFGSGDLENYQKLGEEAYYLEYVQPYFTAYLKEHLT